MIATILRVLWIAALVAAGVLAWLSVRLFGADIGPWAAGLAGVALVFASHPALIAINFIMSRLSGDRVPADKSQRLRARGRCHAGDERR